MELLDLPVEMLRAIMETCVNVYGVKETLGMRMVCKLFDNETIRAICVTKALDTLESCSRCKDERLLSEYVTARTLADHARGHYLSAAICNTVDYILTERPQDHARRPEYIQALCLATVKAWINNYCCVQTFPLLNPTKQSPDFGAKFRRSLIENALAASVYLNATHLSEKLIYNGVGDVNTYFGRPLYVAVGKGLVDIARQILDKEVPTPEVRRNAIWSAAMNGQIPAIQLLLEPKYAANIDDACEWNTFELAARQAAQAGQRDTVLFLVQQASLRGLLDSWRGTVMRKSFPVRPLVAALYDSILWHAALGGQEDMVRLALDNGANIHAIRQPGMGCSTPLDAAARSGHEGVVRLLIARGASPIRQRKTLVQRPLVNAVEGGWLRIAQILIEHGAEVNPDKECLDRVPLMAAVKHRNAGAVRLLLQNGAGLEGCRAVSKEAYSYAALHGFAKIMHILEEYGVDPTSTA